MADSSTVLACACWRRIIVHYLSKYSEAIIQRKLSHLPPNCPLAPRPERAQSGIYA
jgi:hypothetical protein